MSGLYEELGDAILYEHEGLWWIGLTLAPDEPEEESFELGGFVDQGEALNGLNQWAEDRGLFCTNVFVKIRRLNG